LRSLLDQALEQPLARRAAWIEELDSTHADFKPRLRALLAHAGAVPVPGIDTLPALDLAAQAEHRPGDHVGPYRLMRLIAEGGMSSVWLAARGDMLQRRQVALKLPHAAWRAELTESLVHEREILAALNHPHIARLYDAGVGLDGTPYLALEYVAGMPIDVYCAQAALDCRERLRLFLQVARAVAHAHAHGVVHCDLKPHNILVTADGYVRLLDFGIAKLLCEHSVCTDAAALRTDPMTPLYAAPEQLSGLPCGPAADVYSLGVVLYELLTGVRPYQVTGDSRRALAQALARVEPRAPSAVVPSRALSKALRGDLDAIVLKALRKSPAERYDSVQALSADLEAHLSHRPVAARPPRAWYRMHRFLLRHRLACAAAAAVLAAVCGGAGSAAWHAQIAHSERQRIEAARAYIDSIFAISEKHSAADVRAFIAASHARGDPLDPQQDKEPAQPRVLNPWLTE
jgi:serine/threonine-protein kinase